ncbi:hypothetical protein AA0313_1043 [Acetobacter indonesiensis NRIC 0313]|uniref:Uncharacterized protein n=1 Tax=Acetobacter indonesiensis TaxID=104101 RepID=A0A6N3T121_9PROT|nr:hypothetical protein [Acetobacter indonesiensis]GAN63469.1 hypothetical protein Abin_030_012 [Acetobacter indonesiensis]GBQ56076.1 hypothetical protein AA0313_1043 [Acetobacter indonesiensis NRIC 0313]GEN02852.1 hypothetical protein AIN02nite_08770 [Acetobacter indonesiensis]
MRKYAHAAHQPEAIARRHKTQTLTTNPWLSRLFNHNTQNAACALIDYGACKRI